MCVTGFCDLTPTFLFFSRYAGHTHPWRAGVALVGFVLTNHFPGWAESRTSTNWPSFRTKLSLSPPLGLQSARVTYISKVCVKKNRHVEKSASLMVVRFFPRQKISHAMVLHDTNLKHIDKTPLVRHLLLQILIQRWCWLKVYEHDDA